MAKNVKSKKKRPAEETAARPHPRTEIMDIAKIAVPASITVTALFINTYIVFKPACAIVVAKYFIAMHFVLDRPALYRLTCNYGWACD